MKTKYEEDDVCPNCGEGSLWLHFDEKSVFSESGAFVMPLVCDKCGYTIKEEN